LGSTALEAFFNKEYTITKIRGTWLKIKIKNKVFNCLPSFHPAFLLRQPEQKKQSWTDLQIIRDSLKEI
jgi:uracil-DNA glycosylase family 4